MISRRKVVVFLAALSGLVVVGLLCRSHAVREFHPGLSRVGHDFHFGGERLSGVIYSLYPSGRPQHLMFVWRGRKAGTERFWYADGTLMGLHPHKNGLPDGEWRQWYADGRVKSLRTYVDGVIDGESWGWHPNGQVSDYNLYDHGQEITHKSWVADGTPYYNYVYQDGHKVGIKGGEYCKRLAAIIK